MTAKRGYVTVVSGLPRSGTSFMMQMLSAGGMPVLTDGKRIPNDDNPHGYFEYEPVKRLATDKSWVSGARGRAVKVIYKLAYQLPADVSYRMIFMRRNLDEVLRSQEAMLANSGQDPNAGSRDVLRQLFARELETFSLWAETQPNISTLAVDYRALLESPEGGVAEIVAFLDGGLDRAAMAGAVDPALYRNRRPAP